MRQRSLVFPIETENQQPKPQSNFCGEAIIFGGNGRNKAPLCAHGTGAEAATNFVGENAPSHSCCRQRQAVSKLDLLNTPSDPSWLMRLQVETAEFDRWFMPLCVGFYREATRSAVNKRNQASSTGHQQNWGSDVLCGMLQHPLPIAQRSMRQRKLHEYINGRSHASRCAIRASAPK